jgi:hypothetical protein
METYMFSIGKRLGTIALYASLAGTSAFANASGSISGEFKTEDIIEAKVNIKKNFHPRFNTHIEASVGEGSYQVSGGVDLKRIFYFMGRENKENPSEFLKARKEVSSSFLGAGINFNRFEIYGRGLMNDFLMGYDLGFNALFS